jgi:2-oxoglutarate ferredoxin oxidoreductase subunit alpha
LNPLQTQLGELMRAFTHVLVVELNTGQLCQLLRSQFLVDAKKVNKVAGKPFGVSELKERIMPYLEK